MPPSSGKNSPLTFQQIAARLPKSKLQRLAEIKKAYPHIPLERLPEIVKQEVRGILQSAVNPQQESSRQSGNITGTGASAGYNYSGSFSVIGTN
jgi:hypothetical protein